MGRTNELAKIIFDRLYTIECKVSTYEDTVAIPKVMGVRMASGITSGTHKVVHTRDTARDEMLMERLAGISRYSGNEKHDTKLANTVRRYNLSINVMVEIINNEESFKLIDPKASIEIADTLMEYYDALTGGGSILSVNRKKAFVDTDASKIHALYVAMLPMADKVADHLTNGLADDDLNDIFMDWGIAGLADVPYSPRDPALDKPAAPARPVIRHGVAPVRPGPIGKTATFRKPVNTGTPKRPTQRDIDASRRKDVLSF